METVLLLPICLYLRQPAGQRLVGRFTAFASRRSGVFLLALPVAIIEAALGTDMSGGWNHATYVVFLIYGYLFAADARFGQVLCKHWKSHRVIAVLGSIVGIAGFVIFSGVAHTNPLEAYDPISVMLRFFKGLVGWWWIIAIWGFLEAMRARRQAQRILRESSRELQVSLHHRTFWDKVERYANQAVLPFYLLHQTIIIIIGFYIVQWQISALLKFLIISFSALAITLLLYEIVIRRTRVMRFLFGVKPMGRY